jgi:hypothetical protein
MEKRTFYIHKSKNDPKNYILNKEYRVVNFIGGDHDIVEIIKKCEKGELSPKAENIKLFEKII